MNNSDIIQKIKDSGLTGRGGAGFPTGQKWEMVKNTPAKKKYIICNGSEGELGLSKDYYLLKNYPKDVIAGIKVALETMENSVAYLYLRKDYYKKLKRKLKKIIGDSPIELFEELGGYIAGEETAVCEAIEGKMPEPRNKPPYPGQAGLWGYPTLINNVETFYSVAKIICGEYKQTRFYSISGEVKQPGVFELLETMTVAEVLAQTSNTPDFDFFVQVGGGSSGEILLPNELSRTVGGSGAVIVYDRNKTDVYDLMKKWVDFFLQGNCDKCVPCREGLLRLANMINKKEIDESILNDIFYVMEETSFCALGASVPIPLKSLINKVGYQHDK